MRGGLVHRWLLIALLCASCGEKKSVKEQELEVELAKAKAAQAQAEAERARLEADQPLADMNAADIEALISESEQAEAARRAAEAVAQEALRDAQQAKENVDALMKEFDALDRQLGEVVTAVANAQTDVDRRDASARLEKLQQEKAELEARVATARSSFERAERLKGVKISKECLDNPLKEGCQ